MLRYFLSNNSDAELPVAKETIKHSFDFIQLIFGSDILNNQAQPPGNLPALKQK